MMFSSSQVTCGCVAAFSFRDRRQVCHEGSGAIQNAVPAASRHVASQENTMSMCLGALYSD